MYLFQIHLGRVHKGFLDLTQLSVVIMAMTFTTITFFLQETTALSPSGQPPSHKSQNLHINLINLATPPFELQRFPAVSEWQEVKLRHFCYESLNSHYLETLPPQPYNIHWEPLSTTQIQMQ